MRIIFIIAMLTGWALPAEAQLLLSSPVSMVANRFGLWLIAQYVGNLGWTLTSGDSHYSATASLRDGRLHCSVTTRSPEGTFATSGPGLIEIDLGVNPDAENPPARPGGKMYVIRAACPHPRSSTPNEARWSDEYNTYKQKNGDYDARLSATGLIVHSLPEQLKGHWEATSEDETRTMTWGLCHKDWACPGIP